MTDRPLTEFECRIVAFFVDLDLPNKMATRHFIGARVFPERWKRPASRGAMIGHIDRACQRVGLVRLAPRDQWDDAMFCVPFVGGEFGSRWQRSVEEARGD